MECSKYTYDTKVYDQTYYTRRRPDLSDPHGAHTFLVIYTMDVLPTAENGKK